MAYNTNVHNSTSTLDGVSNSVDNGSQNYVYKNKSRAGVMVDQRKSGGVDAAYRSGYPRNSNSGIWPMPGSKEG